MAEKQISWILRAKDSISTVLGKVGSKFKSFASAGIGAAKAVGTAFLAVGAAVLAFGGKMVKAYQVQAQAEAKLTSVLKATGYAAGFTTSQLKEQAAELQKQTGIGDEVILSMQGVLASFRNISGDNFKLATKAILDMSTVMKKAGQDEAAIEQGAVQVGKALNDPIKGISALSRVGVTFTEMQKEQIKTLQESGDLLGAQGVILRELQGEFGGAAEGIDKSVKSWMNLKAAFGDIQEEIGKTITEQTGLSVAFDSLTKMLDELSSSGYITLWAERIIEAAKTAIEILKPVISVLQKIGSVLKDSGEMAAGFTGALMGGASFKDALVTGALTPETNRIDTEKRLQEIRAEKEAKKKAIAETEQAEMAAAHKVAAVRKQEDAEVIKARAAAAAKKEVDDIVGDLQHRIKLQSLLNKGMETEAELLRIQKQLGRELTEQEKARLSGQIDTLRELSKTQQEAAGITAPQDTSSAMEKIGAMMAGGRGSDPSIRIQNEQVRLAKESLNVQRQILDKTGDAMIGVA